MFAPRTCFVDVETTGTNPARDRITEVAVVAVDCDGPAMRVTEWSSLVNPGTPIPPGISWLTGISDPMVRSAPPFFEVAERLYDTLEDAVFVAHNARFDFGFLKSEFARAGIEWTARMLCTVRLSRRLFPDRGSHSLDAIAARFGLDDSQRHRALGDARLLWHFAQRLYDRVPRGQIEDAVRSLLVRPGLPPALAPDALDRIPSAPGVYVMVGAAEHTLYIGKSVDLRSRVAAHFSGDAGDERSLRLVREVERIDWERTAGEIGALLRESQLIKQRLPAHNVKLRRALGQGVLRLQDGRPRWLRAADLPEPAHEPYYGPFASRAAARASVIRLAAEEALCLKTMGMEGRQARGGPSPCFNYQLHRCHGACVGAESLEAHALRLREALEPWRMPPWPCEGALALIEDPGIGEACDWHVVDRWRWLGTARDRSQAFALASNAHLPAFDADQYRIVRDALQRATRGQLQWIELPRSRSAPEPTTDRAQSQSTSG
ncbi:MAG TPA: exonuclease domain-containing protein [Burkholderiaceae bacterium]|nr:exonuclease domain-containing protein [Burkholderiaceae bacterium]